MAESQRRLTPIQRDALLFLGSLMVLWMSVWVAVSFGISFAPGGGVALWAAVLLLVVVLGFSGVVFYWYYVFRDEREPARGEFTVEHGEVRFGAGSFRDKPMKEGAQAEPGSHPQDQVPSLFPRTSSRSPPSAVSSHVATGQVSEPRYMRTRWKSAALVGSVALAILVGAVAAWIARQVEDPLSTMLAAALLIIAIILGGAILAGDKPPEAGH